MVIGKAIVSTTVQIESVDVASHTVEFKNAEGITGTALVKDPEAQRFLRTLKRGDRVAITYTGSVAVSATPAP